MATAPCVTQERLQLPLKQPECLPWPWRLSMLLRNSLWALERRGPAVCLILFIIQIGCVWQGARMSSKQATCYCSVKHGNLQMEQQSCQSHIADTFWLTRSLCVLSTASRGLSSPALFGGRDYFISPHTQCGMPSLQKCKNKPTVSDKSSSCATYCLQWQMLRGECNKRGLRTIFQKQLWQSVVWRESSEPILFNRHRQIYLPWVFLTLFQLVCIWHLYHPVAISSTVIIVFGNGGGECFECFFLTRCWYFASVLPNCSVMWKNKYPLSIYHLHAIHDIETSCISCFIIFFSNG